MKKAHLIIAVLLLSGSAFAQADIYSALTIPDSLKKNADVVVRDYSFFLKVKDENTARLEVHKVVTVLNEEGKNELYFQGESDKFQVLDEAEIKVYNTLGEKLKTYSKKEMVSLNYGEGLVPEGKVTYMSVNAPSYPITIEINYSIKYKGILSYPNVYFQRPYQSVQHAAYTAQVPADFGLRYKNFNCTYLPVISKDGNTIQHQWEIKNLVAYKVEKKAGAVENVMPMAYLAPNKFQMDEYKGDMSTWKGFGNWINSMYLKTMDLSEERKSFFKTMVKDAKTDKEKAAILYQYLQTNMRYVSIQLGIGGFRPFPASFVDEKKYGDCKALSNFLKTALDAAGVKSNWVVIERDYSPSPLFIDFPENIFNHVILCIPQPNDTVWLECTSRTLPFGKLDASTQNRKAMLVTDEGGVLVNTPETKMIENTTNIKTTITLTDDGAAEVLAALTLHGEDRDDMLSYIHDMKEDEKRQFFIKNYGWKQPGILTIATSSKNENPYLFTATMEYSKLYSFKAGNKYFFDRRLYTILDEEIPETENRKNDYHFSYPYQINDTVSISLPQGFTPENLPANKKAEYAFAAYTSSYTYTAAENKITMIASLQIKQRIVKAADYSKLIQFKKEVTSDHNEKIVLKKAS